MTKPWHLMIIDADTQDGVDYFIVRVRAEEWSAFMEFRDLFDRHEGDLLRMFMLLRKALANKEAPSD